jgi:hypothetical protein
MSEVKVCVECKFSSWGDNNIFCTRVLREDLDIVYGLHPVVDKRTAREIRADESSCGQEGRYFEVKPPKPHPCMDAAPPTESKTSTPIWDACCIGVAIASLAALIVLPLLT